MKIFVASIPPEAHIVCELLRSQRIHCEVRGEGLFGLQGEIPFGVESEPYVWLFDSEQQYQAQALIDQYNHPNLSAIGDWQCRHCGEVVEPQFSCCWNCGEAKG